MINTISFALTRIEYNFSFHVFVTHYFYDTTTQGSSLEHDKFNSDSLNSRYDVFHAHFFSHSCSDSRGGQTCLDGRPLQV